MDWIAARAAEGSTSIPGVSIAEEATRQVLKSDSVFAPLFVLALLAFAFSLYLLIWHVPRSHTAALKEVRDECDADLEKVRGEIHATNNFRFAEMREMLQALNTNTAALNVISQSQADRTASSQQIASSLAELILISRGNTTAVEKLVSALERRHQVGGGL